MLSTEQPLSATVTPAALAAQWRWAWTPHTGCSERGALRRVRRQTPIRRSALPLSSVDALFGPLPAQPQPQPQPHRHNHTARLSPIHVRIAAIQTAILARWQSRYVPYRSRTCWKHHCCPATTIPGSQAIHVLVLFCSSDAPNLLRCRQLINVTALTRSFHVQTLPSGSVAAVSHIGNRNR